MPLADLLSQEYLTWKIDILEEAFHGDQTNLHLRVGSYDTIKHHGN